MKRAHVAAAAAAGVVIAGAGGAFAATQLDSPTARSQAIITDAAGQLNIDPSKLTSALEKAIDDQIDAAVRTGKLTSAQGAALKARVDSGQVPLVAGLGLRHFGFGRGAGPGVLGGRLGFGFRAFGAAAVSVASYLGISIDELRTEFGSGKTLAQIAVAHDKTSDGLVAALLADAGKRLDTAVSTGRLTSAQEQMVLGKLRVLLTNVVNGTRPLPSASAGSGFAPRVFGLGRRRGFKLHQ